MGRGGEHEDVASASVGSSTHPPDTGIVRWGGSVDHQVAEEEKVADPDGLTLSIFLSFWVFSR